MIDMPIRRELRRGQAGWAVGDGGGGDGGGGVEGGGGPGAGADAAETPGAHDGEQGPQDQAEAAT